MCSEDCRLERMSVWNVAETSTSARMVSGSGTPLRAGLLEAAAGGGAMAALTIQYYEYYYGT